MKQKILLVLLLIIAITSCYKRDGAIGLSDDFLEYEANGGRQELSYHCIMGIDYGCEVIEGAPESNTAVIDAKDADDIFYLTDKWVSVVIDRNSKTIAVKVEPNDGVLSREYKIALWCMDKRGYITICQQGAK